MKVYVIDPVTGMYADGYRGWVRSRRQAYEFCYNYGTPYAITHAIRHAQLFHNDREHRLASPIRYLDDGR